MSQSVPLFIPLTRKLASTAINAGSLRRPGRNRFQQEDKVSWEDIGAVIVATGFNHFDPSVMPEYGYSRFPNVINRHEMERLNNYAGTDTGNLVRPSGQCQPKAGGDHQLRGLARTSAITRGAPTSVHVRH